MPFNFSGRAATGMRDENLRASLVVSGKVKEERKPRPVASLTFPETTYNAASFHCAAAAPLRRIGQKQIVI